MAGTGDVGAIKNRAMSEWQNEVDRAARWLSRPGTVLDQWARSPDSTSLSFVIYADVPVTAVSNTDAERVVAARVMKAIATDTTDTTTNLLGRALGLNIKRCYWHADVTELAGIGAWPLSDLQATEIQCLLATNVFTRLKYCCNYPMFGVLRELSIVGLTVTL